MHALKSETENESELAGTHANALAAVVLTHIKPLAGKKKHIFMWAHTHTHTHTRSLIVHQSPEREMRIGLRAEQL